MNMSIARAGRRPTRTLSVAAAVVATAALLAACSGGSDDTSSTPTDGGSASSTASSASEDVQVIDQTNLLLVTAQETLEARGLEVLVADASGQGRAIDDPTQWVVVTQDPQNGTVEAGSEVTLTVRMSTDPIS
ncbi:PASTA domain-containing protein [Cellulomonas sp. Marseille-Q8402]